MEDRPFDRKEASQLVDHFFRHQYGQVVASLSRRFGVAHLQVVEDAVQGALEQAWGTWARRGLPDNPSAWIRHVAQNRVVDQLRRDRRHVGEHAVEAGDRATDGAPGSADEAAAFADEIVDDELRMLFACAADDLKPQARLVLCLKLACGFSTREIAARLFLQEANVQKILERGRVKLRETWERDSVDWREPPLDRTAARLDSVQHVIYLQFTEGCYSSRDEEPVRYDLCQEALRLARLLVSHRLGDTPTSWALCALLHFHVARLAARQDGTGELLLLEQQDRSLWDRGHIQEGLRCLSRSADGDVFSRYHGEAAILAEHCLSPSYEQTRWGEIVELYGLLERLSPSPFYTLNRAIALCEWKGPDEALALLAEAAPPSWLAGHWLWEGTLGELLRRSGKAELARAHLIRAVELAPTSAQRRLFQRRLTELESS